MSHRISIASSIHRVVHRGLLALAAITLAAAPAMAAPGGQCGGYQVVDRQHGHPTPGLDRTVEIVQAGRNPIDRFQVVRLVKRNSARAAGVLLVLPPISSGFVNYEVDEQGGYAGSFAAFFADRGYDVWGLSQRTELMAPGSCEGGLDCSPMRDWGMATLLDDIGYVMGRIAGDHRAPGTKPVVGGISLGSMAAIAWIDANPHTVDGALLLEGALFDADPAHRAIAAGFCQQFEGALQAGVYYDGTQLAGLKGIAALAAAAPGAPSPVPGMPPGFTNHQAYVAVMSNPGVSPLTPWPGYAFLDGDPFADHFTFASDRYAEANMSTFTTYTALHMIRDVDCGLAGERTFTGNLRHYRGPAYANAGGHGFGPALLDTLAQMPHAGVELHYDARMGHMDQMFAVNHRQLTEEPILDWLQREVWP